MKLRQLLTLSVCGLCLAQGTSANAQQVEAKQPLSVKPGQPNQNQPNQNQPNQNQDQRNRTQSTTGQQSQMLSADQTLATCVAIANQEEIAIARFAQEKAHSPEVKEFAQMLAKDHQQFLQKLQPWATEAARDGYLKERDTRATTDDQRSSTTRPGAIQQVAAKPELGQQGQSGQQGLNFVSLHRELAENCIQQTKMELSKKDADKFDQCFIGHQIAQHAAMRNKLMVFERHVSGDLNQVFADGRQTTEHHMKRAEEIMKKLADSQTNSKR